MPIELIAERKENSKTFDLGNGRRGLDISIGAIHYKDNYGNRQEQWKDIDTRIVDGRVDKAPFILTIDAANKSIHVKSKCDGAECSLKFSRLTTKRLAASLSPVSPIVKGNTVTWKDIALDTDLIIEVQSGRVRFKRIIKSDKAPDEIEFDVTEKGNSMLSVRAIDANGDSVKVIGKLEGGKLTESIDLKGRKFPIEIDPTIEPRVGASTDDCDVYDGTGIDLTRAYLVMGLTSGYSYSVGLRFTGVTIPDGATIATAYVTLLAYASDAGDTVRIDIWGEQGNSVATFSTAANFVGRTKTTAKVDWDFTTDWVANSTYNSAEIKTIIQELVDDYSGLSSADIALLFLDDGSDEGGRRDSDSYDGAPSDAPLLHVEYLPLQTLIPTGIATAETLGTPVVAGPIIASGIASVEAFGEPEVQFVLQTLLPDAIATAEAFGAAQLNLWLHLTGIATAGVFGTPVVTGPIIASGIGSSEAFGTSKVNFILLPSGLVSTEAFGTGKIVLFLIPTAIGSGEAFGTSQLNFIVFPTGLASSEAFGTAKLILYLIAEAIASAEGFGTAQLNFTLFPSGVASAEGFGTAKLNLRLLAQAIATAEAFGTAQLNFTIFPTGLASEEAFGTLQLHVVGRMLRVRVVTTQYRKVKVLFSQYRRIRVIST